MARTQTKKSPMRGQITVLLVVWLVLACGGSGPEVGPTAQPPDPDQAFLEGVEACQLRLEAWQAVLTAVTADNVCTTHLVQAAPAVEALTACWQGLPPPENPGLQEAHGLLLQAGASYEESVEHLADYCDTGSYDSLDASTAAMDAGNAAVESVNLFLRVYSAQDSS